MIKALAHAMLMEHLVLFNTFNSNLGADQITAFKAKVLARGARSFEHR